MSIMDPAKSKKYVLDNGLTILVTPIHTVPKVSVQMWYGVGSKDEKSGEKGLAHLLEHMIFKGTKVLSESDINLITQKLSGYANAFTSYDYTGYLFDFPTQHWDVALEVFADCMSNCTFKSDLLHAELKAVIQELKMYKDNYPSTLVEEMISTIFADHPYHFPIIGFKQDLWGITREGLMNFYKKHYTPNNATLVVVGDVDPDDVHKKAQKALGHLKPDAGYAREKFYFNQDIISKSVVLYRDVQQSLVALSWVVPGRSSGSNYALDATAWALGHGDGSRLYKKLVDELQLVFDVETFVYDMFDYNLFFIEFQPKQIKDIDVIVDHILKEFSSVVQHGLNEREIQRASKKTELQRLALFENTQDLAYEIGQMYLATGDENRFFNYLPKNTETLEQDIQDVVKKYLRAAVMHKGLLLPIEEKEKEIWFNLQQESDLLDARVLGTRERETKLEPGVHVETIQVKEPAPFVFPKYETIELDNGLHVSCVNHDVVNKIELTAHVPAEHFYDPQDKPGLSYFVSQMVLEGTKNYTKEQLIDELESYGISVDVGPGQVGMTMLQKDLEHGLQLLQEIMSSATFPADSIAKVREQICSDIQQYWDEPARFIGQLAREHIYKQHPYAKNKYGTLQSINSIVQDDLVAFYKKHYTPRGTKMAIVGDIASYTMKDVLSKTLGAWQGGAVPALVCPAVPEAHKEEIKHPIARDQVVVCFAGRSIERTHPDYDKLLLFDQIFSGGAAGSMSSRLFMLREQFGLFYTIRGSLVAGSTEQPGMVFVKTIVSLEKLADARARIEEAIAQAVDEITPDEFESAQQVLINGLLTSFESSEQIAQALLFLQRYGLGHEYLENRAQTLLAISADEVKEAVKKVLDVNKLITILVGRV